MLEKILACLVGASWIYWLVACWMTRSHFLGRDRRFRSGPGGPDRWGDAFTPPLSVLKPVRGVDHELAENLASLCRQDYPDYEILFGVDDPDEPAVEVIDRLKLRFPDVPIRLVVARPFAANRKACLLHHLAARASHDILVTSDSDMRVEPDYLRRVVAPLADREVGVVTCPYVGTRALGLPAGLEALHMGVTFLPSVAVARRAVAMRFAMGASIALRRQDLDRIGGFASLADYLAEDFQVGARVSDLGLRVHLSRYVMKCVLGATTFLEEWQREVRWARCTRVSRPREYPGLLFSFSLPLASTLVVATDGAPGALQALGVSLVLRLTVAWLVSGWTGDETSRRRLLWLPVRDFLSALVWMAAGLGRHVVWRGDVYELERDGRMHPVPAGRAVLRPGFDDGLEDSDSEAGEEPGGERARHVP